MMPLALILVGLELLLLSWLADDGQSSAEDIDRPLLPTLPNKTKGKIKPGMPRDDDV